MRCIKLSKVIGGEIRLVKYQQPSRSPSGRFQASQEEQSDSDPNLHSCERSESVSGSSILDNSGEFRTIPGYGELGKPTKYTLHAKRQLRGIGVLWTEKYPPHYCVFLTGTLPGSTDKALRAIAEWSSFAVDRLKAWIRKRAGCSHFMYVWELQKRGALHLHYAAIIPDDEIRQRIIADFKEEWIRILDLISAKSGVDVYQINDVNTHRNRKEVVQAYAQEVMKSVSQYLAKYVGKDAGKGLPGERMYYSPVRWTGYSREDAREVKSREETLTITDMSRYKWDVVYQESDGILSSVADCYFKSINKDTGTITVTAFLEDYSDIELSKSEGIKVKNQTEPTEFIQDETPRGILLVISQICNQYPGLRTRGYADLSEPLKRLWSKVMSDPLGCKVRLYDVYFICVHFQHFTRGKYDNYEIIANSRRRVANFLASYRGVDYIRAGEYVPCVQRSENEASKI